VFADGEVCSGLFYPRLRVSGVGRTLRQSFTLDPVEVSAEESFLNPMHPLKEVRGLYQGQHWRMRLVDPLEDALSALLAKYLPGINMRVRYLEADVTAADLSLEGREVACWVIDYREPGKKAILARTWVRRKDGAVLRQEAAFQGNRLVMERGLVY